MSERAKMFLSVEKILKKKFQKWLSWDNSNGELNKVTNFGHASPTSMESTDKCMVPWSNWPIPAWNRVKIIKFEDMCKVEIDNIIGLLLDFHFSQNMKNFFTKSKEFKRFLHLFIPQNFLGKLCEVKWNELALTPRDHGARPNGRGLPWP